jgi:glycosyltransferase involved in cell wall biosynthesis
MSAHAGLSSAAPRVTVLMAMHNGRDFLREAVESILSQTFGNFEFIIVDDSSTDDSAAIVRSYADPRIRLLTNTQNMGLTKSLNIGLRAARGDLIARQDADDRSHPTRLAKQVAFMDRSPSVVVLGSQARFIRASGAVVSAHGWNKLETPIAIRWQIIFDSPFVHTAAIFRRDVVWERHGGYDEAFRKSQDFELWSRLAPAYELRNLPEKLVDLRLHRASISSRRTNEDFDRVRAVYRANLTRSVPDYAEVEDWLDLWLGVCSGPSAGYSVSGARVIRHLRGIRQAFLREHPAASREAEIAEHLGALYLRSAMVAVSSADSCGVSGIVREAARYNPALTARAAAKLVGKKLQASLRNRLHSSAGQP